MKSILYITSLFCITICGNVSAQSYFVRGKIIDGKDSSAITGALVVLFNATDTAQYIKAASDTSGRFAFENVSDGEYKLRILFTGYRKLERAVSVSGKPVFMKKLFLQPDESILKEVKVEGVQKRAEQKGDTTIYNADAFKLNKDASTEDLVKKLPGVTVEGGTIKHQGEEVKKILVDGKEFFGDDVNMALKNVPAEMVDKVQVFDRASDQSFFSGFDDGSSQKTINVQTKGNKNKGQFGKLYAGGGIDESKTGRYQAGGSYNFFQGLRKLSVVGMTNNINMQNFGSQDLLGVSGTNAGGGGQRGGGNYRGNNNNGSNNFMMGQSGGISTTHSAGFNYTDVWGKKIIATTSYFFNYTDNSNNSSILRNYFSREGLTQKYDEVKNAGSINQNHRFNMRLEYYIDTMNTIIFNPRFSLQDNNANNVTSGLTYYSADSILSNSQIGNQSNYNGWNSNNSLLYRHRFKKAGRTFSISTSAELNRKTGLTGLQSSNKYITSSVNDTTIITDQSADIDNSYENYNASLSWTEPMGKYGMWNFTYTPSFNYATSEKRTYDYDSISDTHNQPDTNLTNVYDNSVITQKGGFAFRFKKDKWNLTAGLNYQNVALNGKAVFPASAEVVKSFNNLLPNATLQYKFSKTSNLRVSYRSSTNAPISSQLQNVTDNSNTLLLSSGNPNLKQSFNQFMMTRYNITNPVNSRSFFVFVMANFTSNYIANSTIIASQDTLINGNVVLRKGSQFSMPENLSGNWQTRGHLTYSTPWKLIKSTVNFNAGGSYVVLPGLINGLKNLSKTTNVNGGITLSSNISEKLDFTVSTMANYNFVDNTLQSQGNSNYFNQVSNARLNWNFYKGFVFSTDGAHTYYNGLGSGFAQNYLLWTNSLAYKFGKSRMTELKFTCFDVLKQNNSVSRNITETYIEDVQTQVLQRYYLLTFTWNFRKLNGNAQMPTEEKRGNGPGRMHGN